MISKIDRIRIIIFLALAFSISWATGLVIYLTGGLDHSPNLNIAGTGDLLSIHTASHDWERAERAGRSEYPFSVDDVAAGRRIVRELEEQAAEIQALTDRGLEAIVRGCLRMNAICLPAGHYRVEEGSEHFLFYELEERPATL